MPSKKRKYNARFPAGRIKKIMQTDEEVGKVAQAVPIIIQLFDGTPRTLELFVESLLGKALQVTTARNAKTLSPSHVKHCILAESRFDFLRDLPVIGLLFDGTPRTLELFVESLLGKALQVTTARNAKTLSPSHVKHCILAESRFDFLRDLVKNIPDVSAAEEKEMMSAESSPNSSRFSDASAPPRRVVREDSNSSSSCEVRAPPSRDALKLLSPSASETDVPHRPHRTEVTSTIVSTDAAIDLTKRAERPVRTANFYQETLLTDEVQHRSVITVNPTYASPQPSTSYTNLNPVEPLQRIEIAVPKPEFFDVPSVANNATPAPPRTPVTPILNIDFTKNLAQPEIKVLDTKVASIVGVKEPRNTLKRQNSKPLKQTESKRVDVKPVVSQPVDIDHLNSGNLQIDEDYDT